MTNPQGPPNEGPSTWSRPSNQGPLGQPPSPVDPSGGPFRSGEPANPQQEPPTMAGIGPQQAEPIAASNADSRRPESTSPPASSASKTTSVATPEEEPLAGTRKRRSRRDPLSIFLILIIVFSLVLAGVIASELYARHVANGKVAAAVACEVKDKATASFGVAPLLLWQLATRHFTNITVETAGNQVRDAKGMKLRISIQDVHLKSTPNSAGTLGALDATISWTSDGIKESVQNAIPILGEFVTNSVVTHPADGTIELKGMLNDIIARPVVSGKGLELQIVSFNTLGFSLPKEAVQSTLNDFTADLTRNYPLGIHADSVQVTTTGVVSHFSTRNATIPTGSQNPCFANL
ncbi:LmeA family phospholipid-binding protein [Mycobacterium ulcerans]|nr:LmeA family phospholipid-binding protein [Mycobacterium ulcerans]